MRARSWNRRFLAGLLCVLSLYLLWLGWVLLSHRPRPGGPARKDRLPNEVLGVYHVHTKFSDGRKSMEEAAAAAKRQELDFLIVTDHGNPNRESIAGQGWKEGVLVLAGSELSVSRGHLVALGFEPPERDFARPAEDAALEVAAGGGFTVIAHPFSKTRWSWGGAGAYDGIELVTADTMVKKNLLRAIPYLPALLVNPRIFLLKVLDRPAQTLKKWDQLGASRPVYGYFSTDAHLAYRALFSYFGLHVLLDSPLARDFERARSQVFTSLRRGSFYNAVDSARPAGGLSFWAEARGDRFPMGSTISPTPSSPVEFRSEAPFPFPVETRLLRNGEVVQSAAGTRISFLSEKPGIYRLEVYLRVRSLLARDFPWIISNPIYIREGGSENSVF
jgi:hypothetical protein